MLTENKERPYIAYSEDFCSPQLQRFIGDLLFTIASLPEALNCKDCTGFILTIFDGRVLISQEFGAIPPGKFGKYLEYATEKVTRCFRFNLEKSSLRSNDSEDTGRNVGGGVTFTFKDGIVVISCSGFPPEIDEALAFLIGLYKLGLQKTDNSFFHQKDLDATGNKYCVRLLKALGMPIYDYVPSGIFVVEKGADFIEVVPNFITGLFEEKADLITKSSIKHLDCLRVVHGGCATKELSETVTPLSHDQLRALALRNMIDRIGERFNEQPEIFIVRELSSSKTGLSGWHMSYATMPAQWNT